MLQFLISCLPWIAVLIAAVSLASKMKHTGTGTKRVFDDLDWCLANAPAQVAFFMFSVTAAIAAGVLAVDFSQVATFLILTLDILFLMSCLLLILFHRLKVFSFSSL